MTYFWLLPLPSAFLFASNGEVHDGYSRVPTETVSPDLGSIDIEGEEEGSLPPGPKRGVSLTIQDKWRIVRPLLVKYMLPLCESSSSWLPKKFNRTAQLIVCVYLVKLINLCYLNILTSYN